MFDHLNQKYADMKCMLVSTIKVYVLHKWSSKRR